MQSYPFAEDGKKKWPKSHTTVKQLIIEHASKLQTSVAGDLASRFKSGLPFSLTLDEWTSLKNGKYLNINAHHRDGFYDCLGLSRAEGSIPAPKLKDLVEKHIGLFSVDLYHVVAMTTDGASLMEAFGKLIPCIHLKCQCQNP